MTITIKCMASRTLFKRSHGSSFVRMVHLLKLLRQDGLSAEGMCGLKLGSRMNYWMPSISVQEILFVSVLNMGV
jgi:hypothetical protein